MTGEPKKRQPQVFDASDPTVVVVEEPAAPPAPAPRGPQTGGGGGFAAAPLRTRGLGLDDAKHGIRWGAILVAAASALGSIALALSFARFVSIAFERSDWIGWVSFGLLVTAGVAGAALLLREIVGFWKLRRLGRIREEAEKALERKDKAAERAAVRRITAPLAARKDCAWALAKIEEHRRDAHDAGDLMRLVDRHLLEPLDGEARRIVAAAARRTGTVSAISPSAVLTVGWVLVENLRLLRTLAGLYGGRPGIFATAKLARMVVTHIVATGGVALTDDLLGQFLGQDILRRLSRRLGEGVFNAALTARIGAAAIGLIRPLPYLEAPPVRARDFIAEIMRRRGAEEPDAAAAPSGAQKTPPGKP